MKKPPGLCVYCGSPGLSKEHYWGRWMRSIVPPVTDKTVHTVTLNGPLAHTVPPTAPRGRTIKSGDLRSQSLRIACRPCNMGWMREVNEAAAPVIKRLAAGVWWELTTAERAALAAWATLFTMTYEFADRATVATLPSERAALMRTRLPPPNWRVNLSFYPGGRWTHQVHHKALGFQSPEASPDALPMNMQITAFTVGHLLINTVSGRPPVPSVLIDDYGPAFDLRTAWPVGTAAPRRPRVHVDEEIDVLVHGISRWIAETGHWASKG